jgi:hypothetical protein
MSHKKYRQETNCLNCGAEVTGKFCSNCGQENLETKEDFFHLVGHFISDYFHFDSKFFRSLIPLFTKPGFLTQEYWAGRRTRYIHPLRLFFFVTIVFVLSTNAFYKHYNSELKNTFFHSDSTLMKLDDKYLSTLNDSSRILLPGKTDSVFVWRLKKDKVKDARQLKKMQAGLDVVFTNLKYITFFLLPVYALIFRFLYFRRKSFYVDHLAYTMHLQTFGYSILSLTLLLPLMFSIPLDVVQKISFTIIFVYIGFSLHYLYRQQWWKTILKSFMATFLLFFVTTLSLVMIALLDAIFLQ